MNLNAHQLIAQYESAICALRQFNRLIISAPIVNPALTIIGNTKAAINDLLNKNPMNDSSLPSHSNDQKQGSSTATTNPVAPMVKFRSVSAGSNGNATVKRLEAPAPEDDPLE